MKKDVKKKPSPRPSIRWELGVSHRLKADTQALRRFNDTSQELRPAFLVDLQPLFPPPF